MGMAKMKQKIVRFKILEYLSYLFKTALGELQKPMDPSFPRSTERFTDLGQLNFPMVVRF